MQCDKCGPVLILIRIWIQYGSEMDEYGSGSGSGSGLIRVQGSERATIQRRLPATYHPDPSSPADADGGASLEHVVDVLSALCLSNLTPTTSSALAALAACYSQARMLLRARLPAVLSDVALDGSSTSSSRHARLALLLPAARAYLVAEWDAAGAGCPRECARGDVVAEAYREPLLAYLLRKRRKGGEGSAGAC